jgi:hypothetical protein
MTADEIIGALWVNRQGAAMVTELETFDDTVRSALIQKDRLSWTDPQRDAIVVPPGLQTRRVDVLLVDGKIRTAIEVKVSRSDWLRESDEKRRAWRSITHRFVYACPVGLIHPEEIPDGIGLWFVGPSKYDEHHLVVEIAKKAKIQKSPGPLPERVIRNVFYRASLPPRIIDKWTKERIERAAAARANAIANCAAYRASTKPTTPTEHQ